MSLVDRGGIPRYAPSRGKAPSRGVPVSRWIVEPSRCGSTERGRGIARGDDDDDAEARLSP
jgi:hypothetical protein